MSRFSNSTYLTDADIERLSKEYFGPEKPREIDYLAYMIDEFELNEWQSTAFPSMLEQLKSGKISWLSSKQKAAVVKAIKEFRCYEEDVKPGHLTRNWAEQVNPVTSKPIPIDNFDDYDDDIPF